MKGLKEQMAVIMALTPKAVVNHGLTIFQGWGDELPTLEIVTTGNENSPIAILLKNSTQERILHESGAIYIHLL